ncbi:MAG: energy transducer TonB [Spirochaetes bacterium]|nr:energy transducer TonB [Spirochaetota bacterium]
MEQKTELNIIIPIAVSAAFHALLVILFLYHGMDGDQSFFAKMLADQKSGEMRDVIVNMNQDNILEKKYTFLSDKDSTAKGHVTKTKGDTWLNNSTDFKVRGKAYAGQSLSEQTEEILSGNDISIGIVHKTNAVKEEYENQSAADFGNSEWTRIPDAKGISKYNSLFFSNSGQFSYSTKKFKNFEFFNRMKNKIASNWYPPSFANAVIGRNSATGRIRLGLIPSQEVKLYFTLNRNGDVIDVKVLESMGNYALNESCVDSIKMSKNFGQIPADMEGDVIVIPFIFGYYVR